MAIRYYLKRNMFTPGEADHSAQIASNDVYDAEGIVREMLVRGSTLTHADIEAVMKLFYDVVGDLVADGMNVNLPIAKIRPRISGIFESATDAFDPSRHRVSASLSAGTLLLRKLSEASPEKTIRRVAAPVVQSIADAATQSVNQLLTPGGIAGISGNDLKFEASSPNEGIFFVDAAGNETKVEFIATRTKVKLAFAVPATLQPGSYRLEVRKGYGSAPVIRKGTLDHALTVV